MVKRKNILPYAPIGEIMHEATGKRISKDARVAGAELLEDLTAKIVKKAQLLAENSGRKTIHARDITLAYQQLKGGY